MSRIDVGDEVYSYRHQLFARVEAVFPAAVCVRTTLLALEPYLCMVATPELWRADDIENLSVCRYCGTRDRLHLETETGVPFHVCDTCVTASNQAPPHQVGAWW